MIAPRSQPNPTLLVGHGERANGERANGERDFPPALTPLIGRAAEIEAVTALLADGDIRLVTLTGPGGVGKTRLAMAVVDHLAPLYRRGPWLVSLAAVEDPARVLPAIAWAMGVSQTGDRPLLTAVASAMPSEPTLLVLDNIEHVAAAGSDIAALLAACPGLTILATGREPFRLSGEQQYRVAPLPVPTNDDPSSPAVRASAIQLFVDRARAADAGFALSAANLPVVAAICAHLDGLPLAIELAAARVSLLSPDLILGQLSAADDASLALLTRGARDLPPRQQTLRDAIAWSHGLLSPQLQALFRRVAVFAGGFTLDAAAAVVDAPAPLGIGLFDGLADLIDKNLLVTGPAAADASPRFEWLTTIRAFALDQLATSGDRPAVGDRFLAYYADLAARADAHLLGPDQGRWLDQLECEHCNLRNALRWAESHGESATLARMAADLARFWRFHWHHSDGSHWLGRAVAESDGVAPRTRAKALLGAGTMATMGCDYAAAVDWHRQALAASRAAGDHAGTARALLHLGEALQGLRDEEGAGRCFDEALGWLTGQDDAALRSLVLKNVAELALRRGDRPAAAEAIGEALRLSARGGFDWGRAEILVKAADLSLASGLPARAAAEATEALGLYLRFGDGIGVASAGINLALAAAATGEEADGVRLYAGATAAYTSAGLRTPLDKYPTHRTWVEGRRARLGPEAFAGAWAEGAALLIDAYGQAALETGRRLAASGGTDVAARPAPTGLPFGLSEREAEVLRLVAAGLTNAQVADRLYLSPRTVNAHLNRIYAKLGVSNRGAASRLASEAGIA